MTKQERMYLQEDREFLYKYALQFMTLERQISEREKLIAEYDEEAARLAKEVRELQRKMRQLTAMLGNCLDQFVSAYDAGILRDSTIRLI